MTKEKNAFVGNCLTMTTPYLLLTFCRLWFLITTSQLSLLLPQLKQSMIPFHPQTMIWFPITFSPPLNDSLTPSHHLQPLNDTLTPSHLLLTMIWLFITSCWLYLILYHLLQPLNDSLSPSRLLLTIIWSFITFLPPASYKCFTSSPPASYKSFTSSPPSINPYDLLTSWSLWFLIISSPPAGYDSFSPYLLKP